MMAIVTCVEVSMHLFYCSVIIACLYGVGHAVISRIWEVCLSGDSLPSSQPTLLLLVPPLTLSYTPSASMAGAAVTAPLYVAVGPIAVLQQRSSA